MKIDGSTSLASMYLANQIRGRSAESAGARQGDTVTLSSEAKRLLEYFRGLRFEKDAADKSESAAADSLGDARDDVPARGAGVSAAEAGAAEGSGTAGQIEDIRKRIKDLMDKVKHIMDGDMSPEQKHSAAAPYLQQIQELQQQLQELMALGQKKAGSRA
jgi:hypothetical protein